MARRKASKGGQADSWKGKIGAEFSGLERPRDFLIAFAFLTVFILIAALIAWVMFG